MKNADCYGLEIVKNNKIHLSNTYARDHSQKVTNMTSLVSVTMSAMAKLKRGDTISVRVKHKDGDGNSYLGGIVGSKDMIFNGIKS